jgi:hypothetical protein
MGIGGSSPGVKRPVREAYHSPPSNAEVKNGGAIPLLPHRYTIEYVVIHAINTETHNVII